MSLNSARDSHDTNSIKWRQKITLIVVVRSRIHACCFTSTPKKKTSTTLTLLSRSIWDLLLVYISLFCLWRSQKTLSRQKLQTHEISCKILLDDFWFFWFLLIFLSIFIAPKSLAVGRAMFSCISFRLFIITISFLSFFYGAEIYEFSWELSSERRGNTTPAELGTDKANMRFSTHFSLLPFLGKMRRGDREPTTRRSSKKVFLALLSAMKMWESFVLLSSHPTFPRQVRREIEPRNTAFLSFFRQILMFTDNEHDTMPRPSAKAITNFRVKLLITTQHHTHSSSAPPIWWKERKETEN